MKPAPGCTNYKRNCEMNCINITHISSSNLITNVASELFTINLPPIASLSLAWLLLSSPASDREHGLSRNQPVSIISGGPDFSTPEQKRSITCRVQLLNLFLGKLCFQIATRTRWEKIISLSLGVKMYHLPRSPRATGNAVTSRYVAMYWGQVQPELSRATLLQHCSQP